MYIYILWNSHSNCVFLNFKDDNIFTVFPAFWKQKNESSNFTFKKDAYICSAKFADVTHITVENTLHAYGYIFVQIVVSMELKK